MSHPNGLERLLKGLEGNFVDSVDIERQEGFLFVKLSVKQLRPIQGGSKELSFTVMWKRTFDLMLDELDKKLTEANIKLQETSVELKEVVDDLKEEKG